MGWAVPTLYSRRAITHLVATSICTQTLILRKNSKNTQISPEKCYWVRIQHAMINESSPILYSFRRCPYAMRARLAMAISGTPCELREIKLSEKPESMLAASPKGTVPVLILPSERV